MVGKIFDIQRFSIHDGPGARTVVFFKGCNLNCKWCHNPESIDKNNQVVYHSERCLACKRCIEVCPNGALEFKNSRIFLDKDKCKGCYSCVNECFANALVGVGKDVSPDELMEEILTDYDYFISTKGGVTFSGGECMLQTEFLVEVLKLCKKNNIHTAIDTAGNVPWSFFEHANPLTDLYLYDVKAADANVHKSLTGVTNERIIDNLKRLSEINKKIIVRIPLVMGANEDEINGIIDILKPLNLDSVEVLPYHNMGESKYEQFQIKRDCLEYRAPSTQELDRFKDSLDKEGIPVKR